MKILCFYNCESGWLGENATIGLCCYSISSCVLKDMLIVGRKQMLQLT